MGAALAKKNWTTTKKLQIGRGERRITEFMDRDNLNNFGFHYCVTRDGLMMVTDIPPGGFLDRYNRSAVPDLRQDVRRFDVIEGIETVDEYHTKELMNVLKRHKKIRLMLVRYPQKEANVGPLESSASALAE